MASSTFSFGVVAAGKFAGAVALGLGLQQIAKANVIVHESYAEPRRHGAADAPNRIPFLVEERVYKKKKSLTTSCASFSTSMT